MLSLSQPSDRKCRCETGYEIIDGRLQDCVRKQYAICGEGEWRDPANGACYTEKMWNGYCDGVSLNLLETITPQNVVLASI